jgi:hypothetical protein
MRRCYIAICDAAATAAARVREGARAARRKPRPTNMQNVGPIDDAQYERWAN